MTTPPTLPELLRAARTHPMLPGVKTTSSPLQELTNRIDHALAHTSAPPLSAIDGAILEAQELVHAPHDEPLYSQHDDEIPSIMGWLAPKDKGPEVAAPALASAVSGQQDAPSSEEIAEAMLDTLRRRPLSGIMRAQVSKLLAMGIASGQWSHVEEALGLLLTGQMSQDQSAS